jgi:hypothetical protein
MVDEFRKSAKIKTVKGITLLNILFLASGVFVAQKLQLAFASRWSQKKF